MREIVERVANAISRKHVEMASGTGRNMQDEISDFVADLLSKRAGQLAKFGWRTESETEKFN